MYVTYIKKVFSNIFVGYTVQSLQYNSVSCGTDTFHIRLYVLYIFLAFNSLNTDFLDKNVL